MPSLNVFMLQKVAKGLCELNDNMVFVGGAVLELYATDAAASDIRPTFDVDCILELRSRSEHSKLEENLRSKGFIHDTSDNAPICRWIYQGIKVDIMPANSAILGFSNRWYAEGIENKVPEILPDGTEIFLLSPEYFFAVKFEAHKSRGGMDLRQSHDFEDIIYLLDNNPDIFLSVSHAKSTVKEYLQSECKNLLENVDLIEGIESALPYGSEVERTDMIMILINKIAEIS